MATKTKLDLVYMIFMHTNLQFYHEAIKCARKILQRKLFQRPFDLVQLINIAEDKLVDLRPTFPEAIHVELLAALDEFEADVHDPNAKENKLSFALRVALKQMNDFLSESKAKPNAIQFIIFTQLMSADISEETVTKVIKDWDPRASIYLCGPESDIPLGMGFTREDITKAMAGESILPDNLQLKRLLNNTNGLVCNLEIAQSLIDVYKHGQLSPYSWKVDIRFGTKLQFNVIAFKLTEKCKTPKYLPKKKVESREETHETIVDKTTVAFVGGTSVSFADTMDMHTATDGETVYLTKDEKKAHKPPTVRCLDILFVVPKEEINEAYQLGDSVSLLYPDANSTKSILAFNAFKAAVIDENCVVITRKCYNRGNYPKLHALVPHTKDCFLMFEVPFKDYVMDTFMFHPITTGLWATPTVDAATEQSDTKDAIYDYLSALELQQGDVPNFVPPQLRPNPKLDAIYDYITKNMDSEEEKGEDFGELVHPFAEISALKQPDVLKQRAAAALDKLEQLL